MLRSQESNPIWRLMRPSCTIHYRALFLCLDQDLNLDWPLYEGGALPLCYLGNCDSMRIWTADPSVRGMNDNRFTIEPWTLPGSRRSLWSYSDSNREFLRAREMFCHYHYSPKMCGSVLVIIVAIKLLAFLPRVSLDPYVFVGYIHIITLLWQYRGLNPKSSPWKGDELTITLYCHYFYQILNH